MEKGEVDNITNGRCLCGQVQYEIHGALRGIVNCHCSKCRRFHGNYGAYTSVKVEKLTLHTSFSTGIPLAVINS